MPTKTEPLCLAEGDTVVSCSYCEEILNDETRKTHFCGNNCKHKVERNAKITELARRLVKDFSWGNYAKLKIAVKEESKAVEEE